MSLKEPVFLSPIAVNGEGYVRSDMYGDGYFGARRSNGTRRHNGLDIKADMEEPVLASKSGIAKTGWVKNGMGKYVIIKHLWGYSTLYGHLNTITVKDNQWVWQGCQVGEVGKTGNANYRNIQPHLHFEIRRNGRYLDPLNFLHLKQVMPFFPPRKLVRAG